MITADEPAAPTDFNISIFYYMSLEAQTGNGRSERRPLRAVIMIRKYVTSVSRLYSVEN